MFDTAIVAGVMAAKKTHEIIPFCHPLPLERCTVDIADRPGGRIRIVCSVAVHHKTGVEMEALMGATAAALTIYDMCKALSHDIEIGPVRLLRKTGGKRDFNARARAAQDTHERAAAPLYGLVLAGGRSTRMQRDKAAHRIPARRNPARRRDETARRPRWRAHSSRCAPTSAAIAHARGMRSIVDRGDVEGPIAGISAALAEHPDAAWLVLACDLPFLDARTLDTLIAARDAGAMPPHSAPATTACPSRCAPSTSRARARRIAAHIAAGRNCPRKFLINAHTQLLDQPNPRALDNVNTVAEYGARHVGPRRQRRTRARNPRAVLRAAARAGRAAATRR